MRTLIPLAALAALATACRDEPEETVHVDADGDGVLSDVDCNDADATVYPDADELCDGVDNDCDGAVDEDAVEASTWYADRDGDGHGDPDDTIAACDRPDDFVADDTDCDDLSADTHPGADELCDGLDNDCDGEIDEDAVERSTFYADTDGDGFGDPDAPVQACAPADDMADNDADCDDTAPEVHPDATEVCNEIDDDCDGHVDEEVTTTFYTDGDGDGHGDPTAPLQACALPTGASATPDDCDDDDENVSPSAAEVCNGVDDDCDRQIDEGVQQTFYADADADTWGNAERATTACEAPDGYVDRPGDCDDLAAATFPGADERCDGVDNDCDTEIDEDPVDPTTFFADGDGDGFGTADDATAACTRPSGHADNDDDCDDTRDDVFPGAVERCNDRDDDCDGDTDEDDAADATVWYLDADDDGYGRASSTTRACALPSGYADNDDDCNDDLASAYPDAYGTCAPGASCAEILDTVADDGSGTYLLDLDGPDGLPPFEAFCDMDTDGGGWTEITPCTALEALGGTMVAVDEAGTADIDAECRPYTRDGSGNHTYHYTFDFPAGYRDFRLPDYVARAYAGGTSSWTSEIGFSMTSWAAAQQSSSVGDIGFGDPAMDGPLTSFHRVLGGVTECRSCEIPWPEDATYTLPEPATGFRIGWGEGGGQYEGWYPWWSGAILLR